MSFTIRRRDVFRGAFTAGLGGATVMALAPGAQAAPAASGWYGSPATGDVHDLSVCSCAVWGAAPSASASRSAQARCTSKTSAPVRMSASFAPA